MIFVDTNYFLRFLIDDQGSQHDTAKALFAKGAQDEVELFTSLVVFFEIYWVLSSFYKREKSELVEKLSGVLSMSFIRFPERDTLSGAVRVFAETSLDLEDAYNLVYASTHQATELRTFDRKLQKIFSGAS